jgi:3-hydroxyisobutyrate dehydrogenase-like beta-hydroxyacid dehydrogenase
MDRVGFVGLGRMGGPMARRLLDAGYELQVYDVDVDAVGELASAGATIAPTLGALTAQVDVVLVMVPAPVVEAVLVGDDGVLGHVRPGQVVVDGGNSDPASSARVAERFAERGAAFLDIGFSGGPSGATAGTLAIMAGGAEDAYRRIEPMLGVVGRELAYLGPSGAGHLAKALNHLVVALTSQAIGEALAIAEGAGVDAGEWLRVASTGTASSWLMDRTRDMLALDIPQDAMDAWWERLGRRTQLTYSVEAAEQSATAVPLAALSRDLRSRSVDADRPRALEHYVRLTWTFSNSTGSS